MPFTPHEITRYSRQLMLQDFGARGQKRLAQAKVLVVGMGGLGCPAAQYLAAAGIGTLGLVDFDRVDLSNLQRQVLHHTADIGRLKTESAREKLSALNPCITLRTHDTSLTANNALVLFGEYDVVLDGTDTFATRYLINDACVLAGKPNVSASVFRFEGQLSIFCVKGAPCYRCLYPEPPPPGVVPSCGEGGVLGVVPGVIGTLQATETIKYLAQVGQTLVGRLLAYDALEMRFQHFNLKRRPDCPMCGDGPRRSSLDDYQALCGLTLPQVPEITVKALRQRLSEVVLLDVREPGEKILGDLPGALSIPLGQLEARFAELPTGVELVVYCAVGERSARAVELLRSWGVTRVQNLTGGLRAWLDEDP
jgi:sulfur-carrier protein adenylyltransferase/sulfurtransferase